MIQENPRADSIVSSFNFTEPLADFCNKIGPSRTHRDGSFMSASLIGRLGSSAFRLPTTTVSMPLTGSCFSSESAPRPSIMGFEDEVEQFLGRPCRQTDGFSYPQARQP